MDRPGVSIVVPTYNEAAGIASVLSRLADYANDLESRLPVEIIAVDDGSADGTVAFLEQSSRERPALIHVVRHERNAGLVAAMRSGALAARFETVVFLDADLSYAPSIVEPLVRARAAAQAAMALASPYMRGGEVANVPLVRLAASRGANWVLTRCARGRLHTFTGMVRAYDRRLFLELFERRTVGEFNSWAVATFLAAGHDVVEIPAALIWPMERYASASRLTARALWERALLVITTARVMARAVKSTGAGDRAGTLELARRPTRP